MLHVRCGSGKVSLNSITRSIHVDRNSNTPIFILQSWGNHMDVLQAAFVYICSVANVCAYCWLGNELSEQVRKFIPSNQTCI